MPHPQFPNSISGKSVLVLGRKCLDIWIKKGIFSITLSLYMLLQIFVARLDSQKLEDLFPMTQRMLPSEVITFIRCIKAGTGSVTNSVRNRGTWSELATRQITIQN